MVELGSPSRLALVTDDDALIRRVVALALESDGWTVREAADGSAESDALERDAVDLCIMDRHVPGSSLESRLARVARVRPDAAIVVLSGDGDTSTGDGVVHLSKPVELQALRDGVTLALASAPRRAGRAPR
jgi:CheY-like chemotaxis protein